MSRKADPPPQPPGGWAGHRTSLEDRQHHQSHGVAGTLPLQEGLWVAHKPRGGSQTSSSLISPLSNLCQLSLHSLWPKLPSLPVVQFYKISPLKILFSITVILTRRSGTHKWGGTPHDAVYLVTRPIETGLKFGGKASFLLLRVAPGPIQPVFPILKFIQEGDLGHWYNLPCPGAPKWALQGYKGWPKALSLISDMAAQSPTKVKGCFSFFITFIPRKKQSTYVSVRGWH